MASLRIPFRCGQPQGADDLVGSVEAFAQHLHSEITSKIEERIRNVPEPNCEQSFIDAAKMEAVSQTARPASIYLNDGSFSVSN
jgi:hypothetical protein